MATTRVVVHIGPMKTGTTALGAYFSAAQTAGVLPSDVVYPVGDLWFPASGNITKHGQLADFLYPEGRHNSGRKTQIRTPDDVAAKLRDVATFLGTKKGPRVTAVFISETLESRPNVESLLEQLAATFDEVVLVLAVRSPVEAAQSLLVHKIKDWRLDHVDFDLFGMLKNSDGSLIYDYQRMISRFRKLSNIEFVLIPYFEEESDGYAVVDRFMRVVTGNPAPRLDGDFGSRRIHPSLPLSSLKRLVALKRLNRRFGRLPLFTSIVQSLFRRILTADRDKVVRAGFSTRSSDSGDWVISSEERSQILALYGNLGADLRRALGSQSNQAEWRSWFKATGL
jgi:hypothetical protein